jgi:hypothetical protein
MVINVVMCIRNMRESPVKLSIKPRSVNIIKVRGLFLVSAVDLVVLATSSADVLHQVRRTRCALQVSVTGIVLRY